jgi:hypothetical protein
MDRRAIEEGRRQREMERAQRAQKIEEGGDRKSASLSPSNYANCVHDIPFAFTASRSVTRSPEPYRRPRNRDGEHADPDAEGGEEEDEEDAEAAAMAAMGFGGFGTTKVSHCPPRDFLRGLEKSNCFGDCVCRANIEKEMLKAEPISKRNGRGVSIWTGEEVSIGTSGPVPSLRLQLTSPSNSPLDPVKEKKKK